MNRPIDIPAIEQRARQLRAEEMQRLQGLMTERLRLLAVLAAHSLLDLAEGAGELLRPMFSWNPQDPAWSGAAARRQLARLNHGLRRLFSWNPRPGQSC